MWYSVGEGKHKITKQILKCRISRAIFIFHFSMQRLESSRFRNVSLGIYQLYFKFISFYDLFNTRGIGPFSRVQDLQSATLMLVNEMGCTSLKARWDGKAHIYTAKCFSSSEHHSHIWDTSWQCFWWFLNFL